MSQPDCARRSGRTQRGSTTARVLPEHALRYRALVRAHARARVRVRTSAGGGDGRRHRRAVHDLEALCAGTRRSRGRARGRAELTPVVGHWPLSGLPSDLTETTRSPADMSVGQPSRRAGPGAWLDGRTRRDNVRLEAQVSRRSPRREVGNVHFGQLHSDELAVNVSASRASAPRAPQGRQGRPPATWRCSSL
jgi:hypothetical protein